MLTGREVVALDFETTGPRKQFDRIVQIGLVLPKAGGDDVRWSQCVNPGIPIPAAATAVHGITDAMVADAPPFAHYAAHLARGLAGKAILGFRVKFDTGVLQAEMIRAGHPWPADAPCIDAARIWQILEPRTLGDAVRAFLGREPSAAHDAGGDAWDALEVVRGQLARDPALPRDADALAALCFPRDEDWIDEQGKLAWVHGRPAFNFGKWNGTPVADVIARDRQYVTGFVLPKDFPDDTKAILRACLDGIYPEPPAAAPPDPR